MPTPCAPCVDVQTLRQAWRHPHTRPTCLRVFAYNRYNEGWYLLNEKKDIKGAAKKFDEVERQHPYSDWARKALIMSAYTYYESGNFEDSIGAARRYIQLHPGSPDASYAQFLIGT